jgi:hypothetical protein
LFKKWKRHFKQRSILLQIQGCSNAEVFFHRKQKKELLALKARVDFGQAHVLGGKCESLPITFELKQLSWLKASETLPLSGLDLERFC